jgi:hypothetical protein
MTTLTETTMRRIVRSISLAALLTLATLALPNTALEAQDGQPAEAPEAFVPSERLPVDSAVSFPVDI